MSGQPKNLPKKVEEGSDQEMPSAVVSSGWEPSQLSRLLRGPLYPNKAASGSAGGGRWQWDENEALVCVERCRSLEKLAVLFCFTPGAERGGRGRAGPGRAELKWLLRGWAQEETQQPRPVCVAQPTGWGEAQRWEQRVLRAG